MNKKLIKWLIIILVVVIGVLIGLNKAGVLGGDEGISVTAEKVSNRDVTEVVTASGKVFPEVEVKVSPDISGEIITLTVVEGDTVKKGQVLASIYADIYASQRDQASALVTQAQAQVANTSAQIGALKASLDQTEAAYNRQKKLLDQKVISRSEFEQAEQAYLSAKANYEAAKESIRANQASVQSAMASLEKAQKDVSRTTIIAPMDGVISLMSVKKGERVAGNSFNVGTEMMRIADLSSMEAQVDVGENDIPKVNIGDTALVEIDAFTNRKFKGIVYKIANPVTNSLTSSSTSTQVTNYQVHIRLLPDSYKDLILPGQPFPFRPNMSASADIQTNTHKNVVAVPLNAVTTRDKRSNSAPGATGDSKSNDLSKMEAAAADDDIIEVVFVLQKDGIVRRRPVTTDIQDINYIEIKEGIKAGEEVITAPYDVVSKQLKDSTKVKVVTKEELIKSFSSNKP